MTRKGEDDVLAYELTEPFSIQFNLLKIKYTDLDEYFTMSDFLKPDDKVNVFINLETIFRYLCGIYDLEKKIVLQKNFDIILISNILNLAAHYKRFFCNNKMDTRVYLYHTDLSSTSFTQQKYIEDYRTYYLVKYNTNPKFTMMTDKLKEQVLPKVKTISDFIPRVYYISCNNIEGSLLPYVVGNDDKKRKNIIISGEFVDTIYSFIPDYMTYYMFNGRGHRKTCINVKDYLGEMSKKTGEELESLVKTYSTYGMYCSLLSALGDRIRSVYGINKIGPVTMQKYILNGINRNEIQPGTRNPDMIGNIFHNEDMKYDFINSYYCTSITDMASELTDSNILSLLNQRKDRYDNDSLIRLNNTTFFNYPLTLEALCL